jgi:hypothetical protein
MNHGFGRLFLEFVVGVMLGALSLQAHAGNLENVKFYEIEAGQIEYTMSEVNTGTESVKWNNWGRKTVRRMKSTMSMMGVTRSTDQLMYTDGRWVYNVDQAANTATKMESPMLKNMSNRKDPNLMKVGTDFMKAIGGKIVGKETILGKVCDWWEMKQMMTKTCIWRGVPLKTIAGIPGMEVIQTAIDLKVGAIPDSQVSLPSHVKVVKVIDPFKHMQELQGLGRGSGIAGKKEGTQEIMPQGQDMRKILEQLKKMQEHMQHQ